MPRVVFSHVGVKGLGSDTLTAPDLHDIQCSVLVPKSAEYAIRCMAQIALLPPHTAIRADDLHSIVGVPRDYLSKILRKLVAAGLLNAEKGHGGGFTLARAPSSVSFLTVLDAIGFSFDPTHCAFGWDQCESGNPCPLHQSYSRLKHQFVQWASHTTLSDLKRTEKFVKRFGQIESRSKKKSAIKKKKG